jgi:CRISPR/Cas system CSM-associated protein Csm2 small subunit
MERVEIYGWTVKDQGGWRAVAIAVRRAPHHKQKRLERGADSAEEAVVALARLSAALASACRRRGKRVLFRMLKEPPPGF